MNQRLPMKNSCVECGAPRDSLRSWRATDNPGLYGVHGEVYKESKIMRVLLSSILSVSIASIYGAVAWSWSIHIFYGLVFGLIVAVTNILPLFVCANLTVCAVGYYLKNLTKFRIGIKFGFFIALLTTALSQLVHPAAYSVTFMLDDFNNFPVRLFIQLSIIFAQAFLYWWFYYKSPSLTKFIKRVAL